MKIQHLLFAFIFVGCISSSDTLSNREQFPRLFATITPDTIQIGESAILEITRTNPKLQYLRGVIGKYDSTFSLPDNEKEYEFYGDSSTATLEIKPESIGVKTLRGFMEEYELENDSIEKLYRHKFEIPLVVLDTINNK